MRQDIIDEFVSVLDKYIGVNTANISDLALKYDIDHVFRKNGFERVGVIIKRVGGEITFHPETVEDQIIFKQIFE